MAAVIALIYSLLRSFRFTISLRLPNMTSTFGGNSMTKVKAIMTWSMLNSGQIFFITPFSPICRINKSPVPAFAVLPIELPKLFRESASA